MCGMLYPLLASIQSIASAKLKIYIHSQRRTLPLMSFGEKVQWDAPPQLEHVQSPSLSQYPGSYREYFSETVEVSGSQTV